MARILLGLEFGMDSVKACAVDVKSGSMVGIASDEYSSPTRFDALPNGTKLPTGFAYTNPSLWLVSMKNAISKLLDETGIPPNEIYSLGIAFDSCTVMPTDAAGVPLCMMKKYESNPNAWPKTWKHTAATPYAETLTKIAQDRGEPFLENTGNRVSPEWLWPKLLQTIEESPEMVNDIAWYLEAGDWITWQLTGAQIRNQCSAGYKACHVKDIGYPSGDFLAAASVDLARIAERAEILPVLSPGRFVGELLPEAAANLGLEPGLPIGAAVIDAHGAVAGAGVSNPNVLVMVFGHSTAHLLMSKEEKIFEGYSAMVKDGILDDYWGYEAGQPATGDIFHWFRSILAPLDLYDRVEDDNVSANIVLDRWLSETPPGASGLLSLDWFAGNKSPLTNPSLTGALFGLRLDTTPAQIYKSLVESTAFGTRKIIDSFVEGGVPVESIVAVGEVPFSSPSLLQVYADVTGIPIAVPDAVEAIVRGAAIIGGIAIGFENLGYKNREEYFEAMKPAGHDFFKPDEKAHLVYDKLYKKYEEVFKLYGREDSLLVKLRNGF